ncbi:hypothetical protein BJ546DRAFT_199017 [Cryomyces antarcticus]
MSDEPPVSAANHSQHVGEGTGEEHAADGGTQAAASLRRSMRAQNRRLFNKKKVEFLDDILRNFDILVYAELSAVYYMDCSFIRFVLRALIQFFYLTTKSSISPGPPESRPYIGSIFGANIMCLILHIYLAAPEAGEATRGYLHGGLVIDFTGQKGPTSKVHLVLLDIAVLVLQLLQLATFAERRKLVGPRTTSSQLLSSSDTEIPLPAQDHDYEERGILRSDQHATDAFNGIELQPMHVSRGTPDSLIGDDENSERAALLASTQEHSASATDAHIIDLFFSGQIVVADLHIIDTIREFYWAYQNHAPTAASSTSSFSAIAGNRLGFSLRVAGRNLA